MSDKIIALHKQTEQSDIVKGLRNLADRIEAGQVDMEIISTCVVLLGHSSNKLLEDGYIEHSVNRDIYSWGPRCDLFTIRGLMVSSINLLSD